MKDCEFSSRAEVILHNLAIERIGWKSVLFRWIISHEPLLRDAADLLKDSGRLGIMKTGTRYVGDDK